MYLGFGVNSEFVFVEEIVKDGIERRQGTRDRGGMIIIEDVILSHCLPHGNKVEDGGNRDEVESCQGVSNLAPE